MLKAETLINNDLPDNRIIAGLPSGKVSYECHFGSKHKGQDEMSEPENLMDKIAAPANLKAALKEINKKGKPGIDGMNIQELEKWTEEEFEALSKKLINGTYKPSRVRYANIQKEKGTRKLSIPTVIDRMVQRAIIRIISPTIDKTFSNSSYGFRPERNQHQAIEQVSKYIREGYRWIVDIDMEKFFDTVNQDKIISKLEKTVKDRKVTKLIRQYMIVISKADSKGLRKGTPQGGPLSPFLSNIILDKLDKELENRNTKFARYADDIIILQKSKEAAKRIKGNITQLIQNKLKLKVNEEKTEIRRPCQTNFLGFSFTRTGKAKISEKSEAKLNDKIRKGEFKDLNHKMMKAKVNGWINYLTVKGEKHTKRMKKCIYRLNKETVKEKART